MYLVLDKTHSSASLNLEALLQISELLERPACAGTARK